ncbi:hypothetical protein Q8A67_001442 [Cirrhinus molitorella]|uniref:Jacalin-type lectin domain-containing protein n=1 Tax=Cirrhinus molitorella TaxID=172907 RepID=A0AA88Q766_9TELE|nr:hypothetical protein Q8A67_001442 [Cirrhinus molitorella]
MMPASHLPTLLSLSALLLSPLFTGSLALLGTEVVGGKGGDEFSFKSSFDNTFRKIIITYNEELEERGWLSFSRLVTSLNTIQVIFQGEQMVQVGSVKGSKEKEFNFDSTDKIVAATLWPNKKNNRFGGLEFEVEKNNGATIKMHLKNDQLGNPVTVDVKSGKCYGVKGRSGYEIDALGFYFI